MSEESRLITERIRREREALACQLNELEFALRQEPRRWFLDHLPKAAGAAFGASVLLGFVIADRRTRFYSRTRQENSASHCGAGLIGSAST